MVVDPSSKNPSDNAGTAVTSGATARTTASSVHPSQDGATLFNPTSSSVSSNSDDEDVSKPAKKSLTARGGTIANDSDTTSETQDVITKHFVAPASACGAMLVGFKGESLKRVSAAADDSAIMLQEEQQPEAIQRPQHRASTGQLGKKSPETSDARSGTITVTSISNKAEKSKTTALVGGQPKQFTKKKLATSAAGAAEGGTPRMQSPSVETRAASSVAAAASSSPNAGSKNKKHGKGKKSKAGEEAAAAATAANDRESALTANNGSQERRLVFDRYGFIIGESSTFEAIQTTTPTSQKGKNGNTLILKKSLRGRRSGARSVSSRSEVTTPTRFQDNPPESLRIRQRRGADLPDPEVLRRLRKEEARLVKWQRMMKRWDEHFSFRTKKCSSKLQRRVRKGIPNQIRGQAWTHLTNVNLKIKQNPETFKNLVWSTDIPSQDIRDTIERDIHRTFPRHALFYQENEDSMHHSGRGGSPSVVKSLFKREIPASLIVTTEQLDEYATKMFACGKDDALIKEEIKQKQLADATTTDENGIEHAERELLLSQGGQASLRRVLRAYSLYDPITGYCQGMNFIAASFITLMSEEEAFWLLVVVMNERPTNMRGLFGEGMDQTQQILFTSEKLIEEYLPSLYKHFLNENVHVTMFATQWLLTIFTSSFPFDLVLRVWDVYITEGYKAVYRVMLALLKDSMDELLKMQFEEILSFLSQLPSTIDGNQVMKTAFSINLTTKDIDKFDAAYQEQLRKRLEDQQSRK